MTPLLNKRLEEEEEEIIKAKAVPGHPPEVASDIGARISAIREGGQLLPRTAQAFFESYFCHDLSQVRLHTGPRAAELAYEVKARAFTKGQDILFGAGQYAPDTLDGKKLLAHELTHVIQQGIGASLERSLYNTRDLKHKNKFRIQPTVTAPAIQRKIIDIKLPDGKMVQVNCEAPAPAAPKLKAIPCMMKDLKPATGKQKKDCGSALTAAKADSGVNNVIGNLKMLKGCTIPTMGCKLCTAGCKGAGAWHFPKAIYICADRNPIKASVIQYLKHELTHELQDCRKSPDMSCTDRMKMEIESNKAAGRSFDSSFKGAVWSSCYTLRCSDSDINNSLAASMKKYYDSL